MSLGGIASILVTLIDRSEEVQMERQRQKEQAFLHQQSRLASMGEMIGAIAHQWRQPLNAVGVLIQSITYWSNHTPHDRDKIEEQSRQAMEQLSYMSHTIDDFRNFFKVDPYPITVDINTVAIKTVQLMFKQLHFNGIKLSVQTEQCLQEITREDLNDLKFLHTTGEKVVGYPNELMQALVNIFQNSRDAIFERRKYEGNEVEGEIAIQCYENENGASIVICDNGCGIPENAVEHLFEPYFTTKTEGTGIGLYVVYRIIHERFGGKIDFKNRVNGTCVKIQIPYTSSKFDQVG